VSVLGASREVRDDLKARAGRRDQSRAEERHVDGFWNCRPVTVFTGRQRVEIVRCGVPANEQAMSLLLTW
jgi:hypothetical protein